MIAGVLTYLDAALLVICFISGLLAMYRGFAREVLSIISWIAAAGVGAWIFLTKKDLSADIALQTGLPQQIALAVVALAIALIVLIIVHLITARISDAILDSRVGMIDRVLGFAFGVGRGLLIITILYMFGAWFMCKTPKKDFNNVIGWCEEKELPDWVQKSRSLPTLASFGGALTAVLERMIPSSILNHTPPAEQPQQQGFLKQETPFLVLAEGPSGAYMIPAGPQGPVQA
jgi:membrane protein required for colicin V production